MRGPADYKTFWNKLRGGEFVCSEFTRLAKDGTEIFIRGNYNPIKNSSGKVLKIIKFANDITQTKMHGIDTGAKIEAISRAQAVIEFKTDGTILSANQKLPAGAWLYGLGGCGQASQHVRRSSFCGKP